MAKTKRTALDALELAAKVRGNTAAAPSADEKPKYRQNSVNLPVEQWRLLDQVAFARKMQRDRGRASVSAVIKELIEQAEPRLRKELSQ